MVCWESHFVLFTMQDQGVSHDDGDEWSNLTDLITQRSHELLFGRLHKANTFYILYRCPRFNTVNSYRVVLKVCFRNIVLSGRRLYNDNTA